MKRLVPVQFAAFIACAMVAPCAHAAPELREAAILTTMVEAAVSAASLIQERTGAEIEEMSWSARFSERDWVFDAKGSVGSQPIDITMAGYLWGEDKASWIASYSGLGSLGEEEVRMYGQADWLFDETISDYRDMNFRHVMKFGSNSFWGRVLGAEIIVGGALGAAAAVGTSTVATAGVAIGAAALTATMGAMGGASALVGVSAAAKFLLQSDEPVPLSPMPARPEPPREGEVLIATEGTIYTAISFDGELRASGPDGVLLLVGKYFEDDNFAEGSIFVLE